MSDPIYVLIDHGQGEIRNASWEALAMGQQIAGEIGARLKAVLLGEDVRDLAEEVAGKRADGVIYCDHSRLANYDPDTSTAALVELLEADRPQLLLMGHIYQNIDLAPKLAAVLKTGLVTDCIGFRQDDGDLVFIRQMFRNKLNADVVIHSPPPWIVTLQSGACSADDLQEGEAAVEERALSLDSVQPRRIQLEAIEGMKGSVDLTKADVIVGVGRGIKKEENLELIRELASLLGAEIGASRPVVDNDWLERERQIGSSGQNVSPRLYVACGISGAIQHIVGIKGSQCIVAINTDPNAPIFNIARYGIVGDIFEVVPALIQQLKGTGA